jgi:hypothetical protein
LLLVQAFIEKFRFFRGVGEGSGMPRKFENFTAGRPMNSTNKSFAQVKRRIPTKSKQSLFLHVTHLFGRGGEGQVASRLILHVESSKDITKIIW